MRSARWLLLTLLLAAAPTLRADDDRVQFNRDIRPILADKCFHCHGPDASHREADLRLDQREEAVALEAIVPGKPERSLLIDRITSPHADEVMPPPQANKNLSAREKELFRRWIAEGAEYEGHWAFLPPVRPEPPEVDPAGGVNPIDRFIRDRLRREGITPSPEADRTTLIRRLSFDLTGIPPTPEEVEAFLNDGSPNAYEKLVDRLLASPRYGERMAMQWLDYARYADSNGFQTDSSRQMWRWREWVIEAFNRNMPFDRFTIEQLAGDLLSEPSHEQIVATGFHRNTRLNGEGGRIVEEWFAETVIDRVETTGQTWLALTIGCCRCHDHKYDPISQREFYQLFAFFNSIDESGVLDSEGGNRGGGNSRPVLPAPTPAQLARRAELERAVIAAQTTAEQETNFPERQRAWEVELAAQLGDKPTAWRPLAPASVKSSGGAAFTQLEDGSWLAGGQTPAHDTYTISGPLPAGRFSGLRLEALPDPSLPNQSLGRAFNGNFVLTGVEAEITGAELPERFAIRFTRAEASFEQPNYPVAGALQTNSKAGWAIAGNEAANRVPRQAMFLVEKPITVPEGAVLTVRLKHESQFNGHQIGRFRLETTGLPPSAVKLEGAAVPETVLAALQREPEKRSDAERQALTEFFRASGEHPQAAAAAEVAALRKQLADLEASFTTTMVMKELPQPRPAFVLKRGEYHNRGEQVERALPAVLPPLPEGAPLNRLGLAQWLVAPDHPLTARVWVNRQWERLFGAGLVRSIDNFGVQSEAPSHPELLDWLATEFVRLEWDMKALLKTIVMSATYRQSSHVTSELLERDPENRLLARAPRVRLPAELIRDQALAASGLLVEKLGGPSVRPYMPEGVWDETSKYGDLRGYKHDTGEGLYRRTLYTFWKRTAAPPTMLMFDSPSREVCTVKRDRTNTPLQALALLNEITYVEAARVLAERMLASGGDSPAERIRWGFRRVVSRPPSEAELQVLTAGWERQLARFRADEAAARRLLAVGETAPREDFDTAELAAYTLTANVLLNLDEVVTKE